VNNPDIVTIAGPFEAGALRILREIPGLAVISEPGRGDRRVDAVLGFAGTRARMVVEFKRRANAATAWQLVHETEVRPEIPLMLISDETTAAARQILASHGIAVIDGLGNAHIALPGLLFHLEANPPGTRRTQRVAATIPPTRLTGKAGVAAQALLIHRERAWQVQNLAAEAQISAGLAHRVLARLEREGIVASEGSGPNRVRRLINPTTLLDLWAEENVERPIRTLAYALAQSPSQLIKELGGNLERSGIEHAITGAAAASLVAPFVSAVPVVNVWVSATAAPEGLCEGAHADHVVDGHNIVFLQAKDNTPLAFREKVEGVWLSNHFRLYADLLRDPRRGREQADHLRREVIGF
jgi:hypothetical protein